MDTIRSKLDEIQQTVCHASDNTEKVDDNLTKLNDILDLLEMKVKEKEEESDVYMRKFTLTKN